MDVIPIGPDEDVFEVMARATKAANDGLNGAQRELRDDFEQDRYWIKNSGYGFLIFGIAWSQATNRARLDATLGSNPSAFDKAEVEHEAGYFPENRMRGYLPGEAFSEAVPTGELGDTHVSTCMPISREAFEEGRSAGWRIDGDLTPTLITECLEIEAYVRQAQNGDED